MGYRPLLPIGGIFESFPIAMDTARRLKGLWGEDNPLKFTVNELHLISCVEDEEAAVDNNNDFDNDDLSSLSGGGGGSNTYKTCKGFFRSWANEAAQSKAQLSDVRISRCIQ